MIEVLSPGALTTAQDLGRFGFGRLGVAPGGAADGLALRVANLVAGNVAGAAGLEITLLGPRLRFTAATRITLAGTDLAARLDGRPLALHAAIDVPAGGELAFAGGPLGTRAYLAVAGGIEVSPVLGSSSTDLRGGFGGVEGRALRAGDLLRCGTSAAGPRELRQDGCTVLTARRALLRVTRGLHAERFRGDALRKLTAEPYTVRSESDRMGVRLDGPALELERPGELLSEGVSAGAVQVPPAGTPIVLGVDHPATGGYPQIAHVIAADLPSLAQLRPRQSVRFEWIELDAARAELIALEAALGAALGEEGGGE